MILNIYTQAVYETRYASSYDVKRISVFYSNDLLDVPTYQAE